MNIRKQARVLATKADYGKHHSFERTDQVISEMITTCDNDMFTWDELNLILYHFCDNKSTKNNQFIYNRNTKQFLETLLEKHISILQPNSQLFKSIMETYKLKLDVLNENELSTHPLFGPQEQYSSLDVALLACELYYVDSFHTATEVMNTFENSGLEFTLEDLELILPHFINNYQFLGNYKTEAFLLIMFKKGFRSANFVSQVVINVMKKYNLTTEKDHPFVKQFNFIHQNRN